jgi:hypothetical protein
MPAIAAREARLIISRALAVFRGCHLRFYAYPDARRRLCLVSVERDGTDLLQQLVELAEPIPNIEDEHGIERQFFAAPDAGVVH